MKAVLRRLILLAFLGGLFVPLAAAEPDPPVVTVPPDMTVEAQSVAGAVVEYTASATDPAGQPIPVTCNPPTGSTFPLGPTVVTCSATDAGETATKTFSITVVDRTPPVLTVPADKLLRTRSPTGVPVHFSATATDLVDGSVPVSCTPGSGSLFRSGTTLVSCDAEDRSGNRAIEQFTVSVTILRVVRRAALFSPPARAIISGPTMLAWRAVPGARFYNVQLHRNGRKVLSRWPVRPRYGLRRTWKHENRTYRLRAGVYSWYVWPAFGTRARPRYGRLLGRSSFRVVLPDATPLPRARRR